MRRGREGAGGKGWWEDGGGFTAAGTVLLPLLLGRDRPAPARERGWGSGRCPVRGGGAGGVGQGGWGGPRRVGHVGVRPEGARGGVGE